MIHVLVVDDDRLVRKGLISAMPWNEYGMRVVGEAGNGAEALEFLSQQPVDLIMIDLAMPVMSGIELMRVINSRYPHVFMVVLTFHQEFAFIQEALRLGALDYIAKLDLEREQFEEVLGRIARRIEQERERQAAPSAFPDVFLTHVVLAGITGVDKPDTGWLNEIEQAGLIELDEGLWLIIAPDPANLDAFQVQLRRTMPVTAGWRLLHLSGVQGESHSAIYRLVRKYHQSDFFYDDHEAFPLIIKTVTELASPKPGPDDSDLEAQKSRWLSLDWVTRESLFQTMIAELRASSMPPFRLVSLIRAVYSELFRLCGSFHPLQTILPETFRCWDDLQVWMVKLREEAEKILTRKPYSDEVNRCVLEAIKIVMDELDMPLTTQDVANRVNVSRGYFSQVFRDVTGRPFHEYLRHERIERAKEYLHFSDYPVHWVALHTGFADEKYFSQVFREQTGLLPSEYRRQGGKTSGK